jgi:soluble lytic murein transglycosylase-like protein
VTKPELVALAKQIAAKHGVDPALFCALCHHESGDWKPWAIRYEPAFYDRYISHMKGINDTEKTARAFSYGLTQIMGQVARELGFDGKYLTELCDPATNLDYGCRKLKKCFARANDRHSALLLYNGGGNPAYPAKVLQHLKEYQ